MKPASLRACRPAGRNAAARIVTAVALMWLATSTAAAQSALRGVLRVHVEPRVGVPASIAIVDTRDASNRRQVLVGGGAVATIDGLSAGIYDVTVTLASGEAAHRQIRIDALWVTVAVAGARAGSPARIDIVDRYRASDGIDFNDRVVRDLPVADNLWSLVETAAPFTILDRMDTGGLGTGRAGLAGNRGESWALVEARVDGLPIRYPTHTGLLPLAGAMNGVEAVTVSSGLAPLDVGTPGVLIGVVARRPGPSWHGDVDASATAPGMVGTNALPYAPSIGRIDTWRSVGVVAGGPVAERTGIVASAAATNASFFERDLPQTFTAGATSALAHLVSNPGTRDQVRVIGGFDRVNPLFDDRRQFADIDVNERGTFGRVQVVWDHVAPTGSRRSVALAVQRATWAPDVVAGAIGGTMDRVLDGVVPPPAADRTQTHLDARVEIGAPIRRWKRTANEFYGGVTFARSTAAHDIVALPVVAESVAGLPARVWMPRAPASSSRRTLQELAVFGGDRIIVGPRLTLDLGVRADIARGSAADNEIGIDWNTLSPRVAVRWSPAALSVFGGVGRYTGGHALSFLAFGDPGEATWDVRRWHDTNANGAFDAGEAGVLVARAGHGPSVASLDPDLRAPRTTEWTVGAELRAAPYSTIRGAIIVRRQDDLVGVENPGVPLSSYRLFHVPDANADELSPDDDQLLPIYERLPSSFGQDALVLTNPHADPLAYDGIEVTYQFESPRWFVLFGATAYRIVGWGGALGYRVSENDQLVLGDRFWNPNALKDDYGRLFFDRAYVGKWTVAYRGAGDMRYAIVTRYQDGQPFTRFVVAPDLAGGPEIVHAFTMGRTRFTYMGTIDIRVEKGFAIGARRASIRLDAFNITNHANEVEEDAVTGPNFRLPTAVQPPRTLRVGVRFEF